MNWDDLRFVLALARAGSLAAAARELKVDHTTVGRRVEALEGTLGVRLFGRTPSGYVLTRDAEALLPELRAVEAAALAVERAVKARDEDLSGVLRVTTTEVFGSRFVAPRLVPFMRRHPQLTVDLSTDSTTLDLSRREADVAIRAFRAKQEHLAVRRAGEVGFALYASEEYLRKRPAPKGPRELANHDLLVEEVGGPSHSEAAWFESLARGGARVAFRSNSTAALLNITLAGVGLGLLPRWLGDAEPTLRRVPMPDEPVRTLWLTVHRDMAHNRSVRAMLDYLAEMLRAEAGLLRGA